jgi:hypothetical protein
VDPKAFQCVRPPTLVDVAVWIPAYLATTDQRSLALVSIYLWKGARYGPLWITRPWEPYRRRKWGFGTPSVGRSTSHNGASPIMFIHFAWPFLSAVDQRQLDLVATAWRDYICLRFAAATTSLFPLCCTKIVSTLLLLGICSLNILRISHSSKH